MDGFVKMAKDMPIIFLNTTGKVANLLIMFFFAFLIYACAESDSPIVEAPEGVRVSGSIATDTIWDIAHSPYTVEGNIIIEKGATLTIHPGVEVYFDGFHEFIVKGVLVADGIQEPEAKQGETSAISAKVGRLDNYIITFTSNHPYPQVGNWKGITFRNTNDDKSLLRCLKIEYAEIGIDIFSSSPRIMDCFIMNNYVGIQSHGSKSTIMNNLIKYNVTGVVSPGKQHDYIIIMKNTITHNETGITLYRGFKIKENNLSDNSVYAIKATLRDQKKILALDNWWGSTIVNDIEEKIYDNLDDSNLVRIFFIPFAESPFTDAAPSVSLP